MFLIGGYRQHRSFLFQTVIILTHPYLFQICLITVPTRLEAQVTVHYLCDIYQLSYIFLRLECVSLWVVKLNWTVNAL